MIEQLYKILEQFTDLNFNIEIEIYSKILNFIKQEYKDQKPPLDSPLYYEKIAFAFMESGNDSTGWGDVFYSPLFGNIDIVTNEYQFCFPDIKQITPEMLSYWEKRSEMSNPILQCRYAGLVWDFSPKIKEKKANISSAHKFIDSIIKMAEMGGDPFLKHKLRRALSLAVSINDRNRISSLRDAIINYEDTHSEDDKPGTWGYSFDLLIGDKDLYKKIQLAEKQENKIIKKLEDRLTVLSDKNSERFNSHHVEHVVSKLAPYYKDHKDNTNLKRVLLKYKNSFLYGLKKRPVISGSHSLEKIRKILFQYGFSQEAKNLESKIRAYQKQDLQNLQKHEYSIKIPEQEIKNYIKQLDDQSLSGALQKIAISFIPDEERTKKIIFKNAQEHPLLYRTSKNIMDHTGRTVAEIGSVEKDMDGYIIHQMQQSIQFNCYWIELVLNHLEDRKNLNANTLSEHLLKSPVFLNDHHQIIKEGLKAYFNKNYIASCSILIPQIETAIREIISEVGGAVYQTSKSSNEKGFDLRPLGSLLRDEIFCKIFEDFNTNISIYFQILLTDKRGFNFRNYICHGHFPDNHFNKTVAIYIIHLLLILSLVRDPQKVATFE